VIDHVIPASAVQGIGRVLRALRRSRVKRDVLSYLCSIYPESAYPALIADAVGASYENVVGALRGLGERYRREDSLLGLGLVEEVSIGRAKFYRVRDGAVEICRSLTRHGG
jgi:predicted transcriptional regulator with HTH domain